MGLAVHAAKLTRCAALIAVVAVLLARGLAQPTTLAQAQGPIRNQPAVPSLLRYGTIAGPVGIGGLAVNPITHRVYVGDLPSKSITVLDGETYAVLDTIPVVVPGSVGPLSIRVDPNTNRVYATTTQMLVIVDGATNREVQRVDMGLGAGLGSLWVDAAANRVWVPRQVSPPREAEVAVVDGDTGRVVGRVPFGDGSWITLPMGIWGNASTHRLYAGYWRTFAPDARAGAVAVIDTSANSVLARIELGSKFFNGGVLGSTDTNQVFLVEDGHPIRVIDGASNTLRETLPTGDDVFGVTFNPSTHHLLTFSGGSDTVTAVDVTSGEVVARARIPAPFLSFPLGASLGVDPSTNRLFATTGGGWLSVLRDEPVAASDLATDPLWAAGQEHGGPLPCPPAGWIAPPGYAVPTICNDLLPPAPTPTPVPDFEPPGPTPTPPEVDPTPTSVPGFEPPGPTPTAAPIPNPGCDPLADPACLLDTRPVAAGETSPAPTPTPAPTSVPEPEPAEVPQPADLPTPASVTPVDLFAFGNAQGPRPPRPAQDVFPDEAGNIPPGEPPEPEGASTFADPAQAPLTGVYWKLPAGTPLPPGVLVIADGSDRVTGSIQPPSHHTIYAAEPMSYARFAELFAALPWQRAGRK